MARTLLQIVREAQAQLGLVQSSTVIGNPDLTTVQLLAFANMVVEDLNKSHDWTDLKFTYNLSISVPTVTTANTTINSKIITVPSTTGITANDYSIDGDNIPIGTRVLTVDSATQITMSIPATSTLTAMAITFIKDTYAQPTDFDRYMDETWWDKTNRWQLIGPDSSQQAQFQDSGILATGPRRHFRDVGPYSNNFRIWPPPAEIVAPINLSYEYITIYNVRVNGSSSSFTQYFANDADTPILNDLAIVMGIKWRFWEQKGFNWVVKRTEYDQYVDRQIARDGGRKTLSLVPNRPGFLISSAHVQDGYFPGGDA